MLSQEEQPNLIWGPRDEAFEPDNALLLPPDDPTAVGINQPVSFCYGIFQAATRQGHVKMGLVNSASPSLSSSAEPVLRPTLLGQDGFLASTQR